MGSGQTENTQIRVFSVWPLPEVENCFQTHIQNENVHIYILLKNLERFSWYLKKSKDGFPIVLSKCESCEKIQNNEWCTNILNFQEINCTKKHPKVFRNFQAKENCGFKEGCAYTHVQHTNEENLLLV